MLYLNVKLTSSINGLLPARALGVGGGRRLLLQLPSGAGERSVPGVGRFPRKKQCQAIYPAET